MKETDYGLALTIEELIKELKKLPKDKVVLTEGCDCYGTAYEIEEYENEIIIKRHHQYL